MSEFESIDDQLKAKFRLFSEIDKRAGKVKEQGTIMFKNSNLSENFEDCHPKQLQDQGQARNKQSYGLLGNSSAVLNSGVSPSKSRYHEYSEADYNQNFTNSNSNGRKPSFSTANTGPGFCITRTKNSFSSSNKLNQKNQQNFTNSGNPTTKVRQHLNSSVDNCETIFDSLYQRGIQSQQKIREKSLKQQESFKKMASPTINKKSKVIMRESEKFGERLYPSGQTRQALNKNTHSLNYNQVKENLNIFDPIASQRSNNPPIHSHQNRQRLQEESKVDQGNVYNNEFEYLLDNVNRFTKNEIDQSLRHLDANHKSDQLPVYNESYYPPKCFKDYDFHQNYIKFPQPKPVLNKNLSFHPQISQKSKKIAEKLESSFERLTRPRRKHTNNTSLNRSRSGDSASNKSFSSEKFNRSFEMYQDEFRRQEKLNLIREENKKLDDENLKQIAPFKPTFVSKSTKIRDGGNYQVSGKGKQNQEFQERQSNWQKKVEMKDLKKKESLENSFKDKHTFNPNTYKRAPKDDEENIRKIQEQSNKYVNRRQKVLQNKKDEEDYFNKRFYVNTKDVRIKSTQPEDVKLAGGSGSYESIEKIKRKKNIHTPDSLNKARNDLRTNYFFFKDLETKENYDV